MSPRWTKMRSARAAGSAFKGWFTGYGDPATTLTRVAG